jgi:Tol biopolymer transport system component
LQGELIASWEIRTIFPDTDADSSDQFSVSPDGTRLLVDLGMANGESMKDFNGPPPAIWLFEIDSGKTKRLTPKHSYATAPCWLNDSEYLFIDADKKGTSIFRTSIAGGPHKLVVRNAAEPSVSQP